MIEINGQDGGGQILRSALSLSMITGKGFRMVKIRGGRSKPGLMRQHLTCVKAALEVCGGAASGADMHSTELVFKPGKVRAGDYVFKIGTAGSTTLLFQTLLPALMLTDGVSKLEVHGGTHNPMAPSADFIERAFLPQIRAMGVGVKFECVRYGFAPAGGGCIKAEIHPVSELAAISILERGGSVSKKVECVLANVRKEVATKELSSVKSSLEWGEKDVELKICDEVDGSGNALFIEEVFENAVIHITSLGAKAKSAGKVASDAVKAYRTFVKSKAAVGARLADQLLLPMALAGSGEIRTIAVTNHIGTNMKLIEKFIGVKFSVDESEPGGVLVSLSRNH
ncbi:MAG: RNA 3'-terminal phosphate cyclase [Akkermansiaceae bacterium]